MTPSASTYALRLSALVFVLLPFTLDAQAQARWSDPATWGGSVPGAGATATVPAGQTVLLDTDTAPLRRLEVRGTLRFDARDVTLTAGLITVHDGGALEAGTASARHAQPASILLTGTPSDDPGTGPGWKGLVVMSGGTLDLHGPRRLAWTRLGATAAAGATSITLAEPVGWKVGEEIAIASTDYGQEQAEERTITAVSGDRRTVSFDEPLQFMHWGALQTISDPGGPARTLDERAEVALLSRSITIEGAEEGLGAGYGGHVMVHKGGTARIDGAEFYRLGQRARQGRYPVHFHLGDDATGSYVRRASIHHSFNRCLTVHATDNLVIEDNVGYDTFGHCFFLEDAAETGNTFRRNLGFLVRRPEPNQALLPTDHLFPGPAVFWITNPDNVFEDNVAAGSQGSGFWLAFPEHPTGPSYDAGVWPRRTPLGGFRGNVSHSNEADGLHVDRGPTADLSKTEPTFYRPVADPSDPESEAVVAYFDDFVSYRNRGRAVWLRGADQVLRRPLLADNAIGATFASNRTMLEDGVVAGVSDNVGNVRPWEEAGTDGRSLPRPWDADFPIRGFEYYDGQVGVVNTFFTAFEPDAQRMASALSVLRFTAFFMHPDSYAEGLRFDAATNRVHLETRPLPSDLDGGEDGYRSAVFLDRDGSVTGAAGRHVTVNNEFLVTDRCSFRSAWNAYVCNETYRTLLVESRDAVPRELAPLRLRHGQNEHAIVGLPSDGPNYDFRTTLLEGTTHTLGFPGAVPYSLRLRLEWVQEGEHVVIGLPYTYPGPYVYRDYYIHFRNLLSPVASLADLHASTGDRYYRTEDSLYVKLQVQPGRDYATLDVCATEGCPGTAPGTDGAPLAEGTYRMVAQHSGFSLTVGNEGAGAKSNLIQSAYLGLGAQHWQVSYEGSGIYTIRAEDGRYLTAAGGDGERIALSRDDPGLAAQWRLTPLGDGSFRVVSLEGLKAPEVEAGALLGGHPVQLWSAYDGQHQHWAFRPADGNAERSVFYNSSFEADGAEVQEPTGWWSWSPDVGRDAERITAGGAYDGTYKGVHTFGSPYRVSTFQGVTGLPPGRYRVAAHVRSSGGQATARMEVKRGGGDETFIAIEASSSWTRKSIDLEITEGELLVGFYSDAQGGQWLEFDNIRVTLLEASTPLPVELTAFDAQVDGGRVELRWATETETNNDGFAVEHRLADAAGFEQVGFVEGAGTTLEPQQYRFSLDDLDPGTHTFRLKQVDADGQFAYSGELEVSVELAGSHRIEAAHPNPLTASGRLRLSVQREQRVVATLYDALGRRVQTLYDEIVPAATVREVRLDAAGLPSGLYFVRVDGEQFTETQRVMVVR